MCFFSLAEVKTFILKMCIIISPYKLFSAFPNKECGKMRLRSFDFPFIIDIDFTIFD